MLIDGIKLTTSGVSVSTGVATLDSGGQVPQAQIPAVAITDTFVVASEGAMTALTAQVGDVAVRSDVNKTFILKVSPATSAVNWQELLTPTGTVASVNGQTGVVSITSVTGNAGTATALATSRNIALTGGATGTASFNGTADASIAVTSPYDIATQFSGKPSASAVMLKFNAVRAFSLPANMAGSYLKAGTAATGSSAFSLQKNGSTFCTVTFAAAGTTASFGSASAQTFAIGDVLSIIAPGTADATLADLTVTLLGSTS
jgi:hypothetical protein